MVPPPKKGKVASVVTFGAICSANNSHLDYLIRPNSVARCSRVQIIVLKVHTTAQIRPAHAVGAAMTAVSQMAFTVRYDDEAHRKLRSLCGGASRLPTAWARPIPVSNETSLSPLLSDAILSLLGSDLYSCKPIPSSIYGEVPHQNYHWIQLA